MSTQKMLNTLSHRGKGNQNHKALPPHTHQGTHDQKDATTQVNLENVMLSERIQIQNATFGVVLCI